MNFRLARLVLAGLVAVMAAFVAMPAAAQAQTVNVTASNWKFAPSSITLHVGETTHLRLTSAGGVHGIKSSELGIPLTTISPGKTVTVNITPKKTGTYVLHRAIMCGPGHQNMALTVVVAAGGPVAMAQPQIGVSISASNWKFTPGTVTMYVGKTTHLRLSSAGGVHGIKSIELGIPLTVITPGKVLSVDVTPKKAGTYLLHCAVMCGPGHSKMALTIIVLAAK